MDKNGAFFAAIVRGDQFISSVWDPYVYRRDTARQALSHFVTIRKPTAATHLNHPTRYRPIEYRDIPHGDYLSFSLEPADGSKEKNLPMVGESALLFGTMRAYLGNALVTPAAQWIGQQSPINFEIKSEFVAVCPHDDLVYFWLAYLRSKQFLENLPLGSGGTRPRLQPSALERTPVTLPSLSDRQRIHCELQTLAQTEWENRCAIARSLAGLAHHN